MKALLSRMPGGPETLALEDVPDPRPGPSEAVVAVKACGVNFPDLLMIKDLYQHKPPRPFSPGCEIAGVVETVGPNVSDLRSGDRVIGWCGFGGMAEKVALSPERCVPIPNGMPFEEAAAFIMTYGTSYYALHGRAALKPGETVLVLGAAGGVGIAAVELAKAAGARVVAAASSEEKVAVARERGADTGVVYPRGPFDKAGARALADLFKEACGPMGADVVYDAVGGDYSEAALRALAWGGRLLVVGFPAGIARIPLNLPLLKSCQIVGVAWGSWVRREPEANRQNNRELLALYTRGAVRPHISARFPLLRAAEAIAALEQRRAVGKLVVTVP